MSILTDLKQAMKAKPQGDTRPVPGSRLLQEYSDPFIRNEVKPIVHKHGPYEVLQALVDVLHDTGSHFSGDEPELSSAYRHDAELVRGIIPHLKSKPGM